MRTVTWTCDKCQKDCSGRDDQLWEVALVIKHVKDSHKYSAPKMPAQWCRECTEKAGLLPWVECKTPEQPAPPSLPTIEDLIREIAAEAGAEAGAQAARG